MNMAAPGAVYTTGLAGRQKVSDENRRLILDSICIVGRIAAA